MSIRVGASPTGEAEQRVLAAYRLFVNGHDVGIGPGRGDAVVGGPIPFPGSFIYDTIEVPRTVLTSAGQRLSLALECYHEEGNVDAWTLLEAHAFDESNRTIGVYGTGRDWFGYDARWIFRRGRPDLGSAYQRCVCPPTARSTAQPTHCPADSLPN